MSLPEPDPSERFSKKSVQWLLQEHKRMLLDNREQKRARTLPSLDRPPLGLQELKDAAASVSLKGLLLRTTRHYRPPCVGTTLPPQRLSDGRFGAEAHRSKCCSAKCDFCPPHSLGLEWPACRHTRPGVLHLAP
eukprot:4958308-Pyramimonas_sp.AAC.1